MNKNIFKSVLVLTLIGIACGVLIGLTNFVTAKKIDANRAEEAKKVYEGFFPTLDTIKMTELDGKYAIEYVEVLDKDEKVVGHAFRSQATNARGLIDLVVAADDSGQIKGIKIIDTENTPGYYDLYEDKDGNLKGVKGDILDDLKGIDNIANATQTGDTLDAMIKEIGEIAPKYITVEDSLDEYEELFGEGVTSVVDEDFVATDIVSEKTAVYDEEGNLIGNTYKGTIIVEDTIPRVEKAELTLLVGVDLDGKIVGVNVLVVEHTPGFFNRYKESLSLLEGEIVENLEVDSIVDATISGGIINEIFEAIKGVIINE